MAMSALSLDFRREVSILIDERRRSCATLNGFYADLSARAGDVGFGACPATGAA